MSTIAKFVTEMELDPAGVRAGLDKAEQMIRNFSKTASTVTNTANVQVQAVDTARAFLGTIRRIYDSESGAAREALVRGVISQDEFRVAGKRAADNFNMALLAGIENMRSRGLMTSESMALLQNDLEPALTRVGTAGVKGASGISRIKTELVTLGSHMLGILPVEGRVVSTLGYFAVGSAWLIGIVAGVVLLTAAWQKFTEKQRDATKAAEDFKKTDDAFRAAHMAEGATRAQLGTVPGARVDMIDVVGSTEAINKTQMAVAGLRAELEKTGHMWNAGSALAESKALELLRHQYAAGTIDASRFRVELAKIGIAHPDAAGAIAETATLGAQYDAARDALTRLTAVEEHNRALQAETTAAGPVGGIAKQLEDAERRLTALQSGGKAAMQAVDNEIAATKDATEAWNTYVTTKDGARFATLTFTAALAAHNPVAEKARVTALKLAEANAAIAEGTHGVKSPIESLEQLTTRLLAWHTAAEKAGTMSSEFAPRIANAIVSAEKMLSKQTDKMSDDALRLQEILAKLREAFLKLADTPLPDINLTPGARLSAVDSAGRATEYAGRTSLLRGGPQSTIGLRGPGTLPGFTGPQLTSPQVALTIEAPWRVRFNAYMSQVSDFAGQAAAGLGRMVRSGGLQILASIVSQLNPFGVVVKALSDAMKPLEPVLTALGKIVADILAPIFTALAPIIRAFIPFFRALLQIIAPLVQALLPLIEAFVPILEALFPLIKFAAIVLTYFIQAAAESSSILLRFVGNVVIVIGTIFKALAEAIDALPFVSAKHAIDVAQGVIDFGRGMLGAADDFKKTADQMADARKAINRVNIDHTVDGINDLGDAAASTAAALLNVPTWFKLAGARFAAATPHGGTTIPGPNIPPPVPTVPPLPPAGGGSTGATGGYSPKGGPQMYVESLSIDARALSPDEILDAVMTAGKRRARAQGVAHWSEVR